MSVLPSTVGAMTEVKSDQATAAGAAPAVREAAGTGDVAAAAGIAAELVSGGAVAHVPFADLEFAIVDVETTGWDPEDSGITEIGAVRVRCGQIVAEFTSLVNPGAPVPEPIAELTGISDTMLAPAPPVAAVLPGLLAFARNCVLAAHNARFDVGFLSAACASAAVPWPGYPVVDTLRLARQLMVTPDEVPDCKLGTLAEFFGTPVQPSHRALADARATAWVLRQLLRRLDDRGIATLADLMPWLEAREAAQAAEAEAEARAAAEATEAIEARAAAEAEANAEAEAEAQSGAGSGSEEGQETDAPKAGATSEPSAPEEAAGR